MHCKVGSLQSGLHASVLFFREKFSLESSWSLCLKFDGGKDTESKNKVKVLPHVNIPVVVYHTLDMPPMQYGHLADDSGHEFFGSTEIVVASYLF